MREASSRLAHLSIWHGPRTRDDHWSATPGYDRHPVALYRLRKLPSRQLRRRFRGTGPAARSETWLQAALCQRLGAEWSGLTRMARLGGPRHRRHGRSIRPAAGHRRQGKPLASAFMDGSAEPSLERRRSLVVPIWCAPLGTCSGHPLPANLTRSGILDSWTILLRRLIRRCGRPSPGKKMKCYAYLFAAAVMASATTVSAATIAACGSQKGRAYYPAAGFVSKKDSGWSEDQISKGSTTLTRDAKGAFDVLYVDARGKIISARDDGGVVEPLRRSQNEVSVLVYYPDGGGTTEIYSFVREVDGKTKMLQLSSKGVVSPLNIPKAGVYVADCNTFNP